MSCLFLKNETEQNKRFNVLIYLANKMHMKNII